MRSERVLILSDQPLFAQGICALIQASDVANVIGIEPCDENTIALVRELHPDTIILEDAQDSPPSLVMALVDALSNVRLIRLSLDKNVMRVYEGHELSVNGAQDLVHILKIFSQGLELA